MTLAEIFDNLEKKAKEIESEGTFTGDNKAIASILLAGLTELTKEKR